MTFREATARIFGILFLSTLWGDGAWTVPVDGSEESSRVSRGARIMFSPGGVEKGEFGSF